MAPKVTGAWNLHELTKDSDLDFLHHFSEKGSRFERAEPLLAKRFSQSVHFASDIGERIGIAAVAACPNVTYGKSNHCPNP